MTIEHERFSHMAETKTSIRHSYERTIPAQIEDVWRAITDSDELESAFFDNLVESTFMPGEPVRYISPEGVVMVDGMVLDVDEPHRLVHSFVYTVAADPEAADDSPSRVTWALEPGDEGTHVSLVHEGFDSRNATWRSVEDGWDGILDALERRFDTDTDDD